MPNYSDPAAEILREVQSGSLPPDEALARLRALSCADLGYAKIDLARTARQGLPEVIYGEGKTPAQIRGILDEMAIAGQERVLVTRLCPTAAREVCEGDPPLPITYDPLARAAYTGSLPQPDGAGTILIATAGTSDIPVAREAALTARFCGNEVRELFDVGVAGLHRLLAHIEDLRQASVIIAAAGMEGALASVIGGIAACPVIALPTSVGYGANLGGLTPLLAMLSSCAAGVGVVNIDNGFGAAVLASRINHPKTSPNK